MKCLSDFIIPKSLTAYHPLSQRGLSKLLHIPSNKHYYQKGVFNDIASLLYPGDLLILNNTKVIPSHLNAYKKTGGKVGVTLTEIKDQHHAWAMLKSPPKIGIPFCIDKHSLSILKQKDHLFYLHLSSEMNFYQLIEKYGSMTLPPYIKRKVLKQDNNQYQSVFAQLNGSIASPTASLHFNQRLLSRLKNKGVEIDFLTLHVGLGTFLPIKSKQPEKHIMHAEKFFISNQLAKKINRAKKRGQRIIAVGTTALRALESASSTDKILHAKKGVTTLFIRPGYQFKMIDALVTNFHQPNSTLIHLVCALAGHTTIQNAYQYAKKHRWQFFSYGDCMFIEK